MATLKLPASKTTVTTGAGGVVFVLWEPVRKLFDIGAAWSASWPGVFTDALDFLQEGNFQFGIMFLLTLLVGQILGRDPVELMPADSADSGDQGGMPQPPKGD